MALRSIEIKVSAFMNLDLDILNRDSVVERIIDILQGLRENQQHMVFSLNGKWGSGKTFVLKLLEHRIEEENKKLAANERKVCFVRYDCWKYDYYSEPLVALVAAMRDAIIERTEHGNADYIDEEFKNTAKELAKWGLEAGCSFLKAQTGLDVFKLIQNMSKGNKRAFEECFSGESSITEELNRLRNIMRKISKDVNLVIVVDELDRCLPEYMVRVLERLHHFFEGMENIVIIIATDRAQMEYTIKQIYGVHTDAGAYLKKIIQFELSLDYGVIKDEDVLKKKFSQYLENFDADKMPEEPPLVEYFEKVFKDIEIRTVIQWVDKINLVHRLSFGNRKTGYDVLFFELFWTVFTKVYKIVPISKEITISLDNPFSPFMCLSKTHKDWKNISFIKYLSDKIGRIPGDKEWASEPTNIIIRADVGIINMMFWYWTRTVRGNKQHYYLPMIHDEAYLKQFEEESVNNVGCLKIFQEIIDMIN